MSKRLTSLTILIVLVLSGSVQTTGRQKEIDWQRDFNKAIKLAKEQGKPVLIDFWASWCPPCREMDQEVWPRTEIVALSEKFVCISVDIDRNGPVAAKYRANPIPTLILADPWGNEIVRHVGYVPARQLARMMETFPSDFTGLNQWNAILAEDRDDLEALAGVANFYGQIGAWDLGNRYYERALKTKEAKQDPQVKETLMVAIGLNHIKLREYKDARKIFEKCLKEIPNGPRCDRALLGLITAQLGQGQIAEAESTFAQLQSQFPDSPATEQAARNLRAVKSPQP